MASKGRVPPTHLRRPIPGPGAVHPDPYASAIRPPHGGGFPPYEMLPPHEVMAHKLSAQHIEIEKLATENRRFAATHGTLRQDLASANHDLQLIHAHIADVGSEKEQQMRGIMDKISVMESELEAAGAIKTELQQARAEAERLIATRQELILSVQKLNHDLQMAHSDAQQIPSLMAELDSLRQEYQHCRATYDYEKKLYNDHLESLRVMEKNYMAMSVEVEKLRAELTNYANFETANAGVPYSGSAGYNPSNLVGSYAYGQNTYGVGQQGQGPLLGGSTGVGPSGAAIGGNSPHIIAQQSAPYGSANPRDGSRPPPAYGTSKGTTGYDPQLGHVGAGYDPQMAQTGPSYDPQRAPTGPGYEASRGPTVPGYEAQRGPTVPGYEAQRGPTVPGPNNIQRGLTGNEAQRGLASDPQKLPGYEAQKTPAYDMQRSSGDEAQRAANYEAQKGASYDASSRGGSTVGAQGQVAMNNPPYAPTPNANPKRW